jgi:hypothetical protein
MVGVIDAKLSHRVLVFLQMSSARQFSANKVKRLGAKMQLNRELKEYEHSLIGDNACYHWFLDQPTSNENILMLFKLLHNRPPHHSNIPQRSDVVQFPVFND